jgi:hypothetical protein
MENIDELYFITIFKSTAFENITLFCNNIY